ncbi:glycosyl hydrolase family 3 N terminal domain-containing protein, partial [Aureobasidium melanogenum]
QIYESLWMLGAAKDVGTKYWESGLTLDKKNGTGVECLKVIFPGLTSIRVVSTSAASQSWFPRNGNDSHFATGKDNTYFGDFLDYHLIPFKAVIAAGGRQIMPSYARPIGTKYPEVAFGFNKPVITGLLREELGFNGIVVSDSGLITDAEIMGVVGPARAWGVETTTELERGKTVLDAGVDQFGGEIRTELLVRLVNEGQIPESRLDVSVRKLLEEIFMLGLFDKRFVDPEAAERVVGNSY